MCQVSGQNPDTVGEQFAELVAIMAKLRSPEGCPWDKEQTHSSLAKYLIEECYEAVESIERGSMEALREELGDLLLQVVFQARLAEEEGLFSVKDVLEGIISKLLGRHPHVFSEAEAASAEEVLALWEELKRGESEKKGSEVSLFGGIPLSMPALARAQAVQREAARVGFDWSSASGAWDRLADEVQEVKEAAEEQDPKGVEEELGDFLFSVVNACRFAGVDAETALRGSVRKFVDRFSEMERMAAEKGLSLEEMSLPEMDKLWEASKKRQL